MNARTRLFVVLVAGSITVAGCSREQVTENEQAIDTAGRPDSELATDIEGRFYRDDLVRGDRIDVEVKDGVATLRGTARTEAVRQHAITVARDVPGVSRVEDQLRVAGDQDATARATSGQSAAGPRTDDATTPEVSSTLTPGWITTKIQAQYFVSGDVKPWNIDVTTRPGGVVELSGTVDDQEARQEAIRIARETEGVTRVEDRLRVGEPASSETAAARTDPGARTEFEPLDVSDVWVTTKVQSKYYLDDDIRGFDIDVTTMDGVVTLTGTVESSQERRQAVALARNTEGVRDVRDQLQVQAGNRAVPSTDVSGTSGRTSVEPVEDGWITTKIQAQYFLDALVKGHEINVDTRNGVVTLHGSVESEMHKAAAEVIARETEGVRRVRNQLTIEP